MPELAEWTLTIFLHKTCTNDMAMGNSQKKSDGRTPVIYDIEANLGARSVYYAWIQHFIHHLSPVGVAGLVFANGIMSLNQSGESSEGEV